MDILKKKKYLFSETDSFSPKQPYYYNIYQKRAKEEFIRQMQNLKNYMYSQNLTPIFLCIGSDRATGDCFGPLVGEQLTHYFSTSQTPCIMPIVYGTLKNPVHAVNLSHTIKEIQTTFYRPFVIAIDASLGIRQHIGYITLGNGPLLPGIGVQKNLPHIGNAAITGIVNLAGKNSHLTLQTTKLSTVIDLAEFTASGIISVYR